MKTIEVIKPTTIENESGTYKVWAEKIFCNNRYVFKAKQISVKANGEHHSIEPSFPRLRYCELCEPPIAANCSHAVNPLSIKTYEVELNQYREWYIGKITELKCRFGHFCYVLEHTFKENKIRQIL